MAVRKSKNSRGFTLIEIIVSIAIVGIMATTFFGLFGFGIKTIIVSGQNSSSNFDAQSVMENRAAGDLSELDKLEEKSGSISLYQSGVLITTFPIEGTIIEVPYPYNNEEKKVVTFIPD